MREGFSLSGAPIKPAITWKKVRFMISFYWSSSVFRPPMRRFLPVWSGIFILFFFC